MKILLALVALCGTAFMLPRGLGAIASTMLPMRTVDMGMPILAMHSARELTGTCDPWYMEALLQALFAE